MDRRKLLSSAALTAFSLSAFGTVTRNLSGDFTGDCETTNDILGPFYRPDAPLRNDLTFAGLKGTQLVVKGKVLKPDCTTPIKNALVEIWHCDTEGEYDNTSKAFRLRGSWKTNEKGEYAFKTILPGKYLNGELYRPAHIHFRVPAKGSRELVSQIYFKGDPNIPADPWASPAKAVNRILTITPDDINSNLAVHFDIVLKDR